MPASKPKGGDDLVQWMIDNNIDVTRENYIDLAYIDTPDPWTAVQEELLPEELQDWDLFDIVDGELIYGNKQVA